MAARSLNKVQLIGNLTRDPELRYTPQGTAVCTFGLATNRTWVTDTGEKRESTEFHRIVAWNKLAELCAQLLFKGRKVFVEGRLQTRQWTAQDGTPRQTTEVVIADMIILDSKRAPGGEAGAEVEDVVKFKKGMSARGEKKTPAKGKKASSAAGDKAQTRAGATDDQAAASDEPAKKKKKEGAKTKKATEEVKAEDIPF